MKDDKTVIDASYGEDISSQVFGRYQHGFIKYGFGWSDDDETTFGIKWGALSEPDKVRVRYVPLFRLWQLLGFIPKGPHK